MLLKQSKASVFEEVTLKQSPNKRSVQPMQISGGRVYLVEETLSAKALGWKSTYVLEGPRGSQSDWNEVGVREGRQVQAMSGRVLRDLC